MADTRPSARPAPPLPPSPTSACPPRLVAALAEAGHHHPVPDPVRHAARLAGRPRRPRPGPHRLGQDLRVRAAAGRPARRQPAAAPSRAAPRPDPRPDPRARHPDRRRRWRRSPRRWGCARRPSSAACKPGPQIQALRNGVDIVIACPGRLEDHCGPVTPTSAPIEVTVLDEADHMADLGFLPGVRRLLDRTPRRRPADAVLRHARHRRRRAGQALPARPGRAQRRLRAVAGRHHDPPRAARRRGGPARRASPTSPPRPAARSSSPAPSTAPRRSPASSTPAACPRSSCTATCRRARAPATSRRSLDGTATHAGRHRHRRPWHPRRRRRPGRARRPAGRAQGLPAPLRPHRARRRTAGTVVTMMLDAQVSRRPRPDPQGRDQAHHHPGRGRPPAAPGDRSGRAHLRRA